MEIKAPKIERAYENEYQDYLKEYDAEWGNTLGMAVMGYKDWVKDLDEQRRINKEEEKLGSRIIREYNELHVLDGLVKKCFESKDVTIEDVENGTALEKAERVSSKAQNLDQKWEAEHLIWRIKNYKEK